MGHLGKVADVETFDMTNSRRKLWAYSPGLVPQPTRGFPKAPSGRVVSRYMQGGPCFLNPLHLEMQASVISHMHSREEFFNHYVSEIFTRLTHMEDKATIQFPYYPPNTRPLGFPF